MSTSLDEMAAQYVKSSGSVTKKAALLMNVVKWLNERGLDDRKVKICLHKDFGNGRACEILIYDDGKHWRVLRLMVRRCGVVEISGNQLSKIYRKLSAEARLVFEGFRP